MGFWGGTDKAPVSSFWKGLQWFISELDTQEKYQQGLLKRPKQNLLANLRKIRELW